MRKGQAVALQMPIPFGVVGHDPSYRSVNQYDPVTREQAARLFRLQEGQGRLAHAARRQAARAASCDRAEQHAARARRAVAEVARERSASGWKPRSRNSSTTCRRRRRASCRCGARAGSPTIRTATISCSCSTARTSARATRAATNRRRSTSSTKRRALLPNSPERNLLFLEMSRQMEVDAAWTLAGLARAQRSHPAVDPGLQEAPDPAGRLAVSRRRRRIDPAIDASFRPRLSRLVAIARARGVRSPRLARRRRRVAADMNKVIRHVFPAGEEGFDPAAAHDLYSGTVESGDLRDAAHLRLPRAAVEARPAHGGSAAADHRQRPDVHDQAQEGHPFHARPGVQGRRSAS